MRRKTSTAAEYVFSCYTLFKLVVILIVFLMHIKEMWKQIPSIVQRTIIRKSVSNLTNFQRIIWRLSRLLILKQTIRHMCWPEDIGSCVMASSYGTATTKDKLAQTHFHIPLLGRYVEYGHLMAVPCVLYAHARARRYAVFALHTMSYKIMTALSWVVWVITINN